MKYWAKPLHFSIDPKKNSTFLYRDGIICIIFSVSNLHMKYTFYIAISNHFKTRFTCHIYTGSPTILYCKSNFLYTLQYISKQCTSQQAFIVKTESSLWTHYTLHITKDKSPRPLSTISVGILNISRQYVYLP